MRIYKESRYNYQCDFAEFLKNPPHTETVKFIEPDTLEEAHSLLNMGYQVRTHLGIPPYRPKYEVGQTISIPQGSFEITQILTYYNAIKYYGRLTIEKDGKKETLVNHTIDEKEMKYENYIEV